MDVLWADCMPLRSLTIPFLPLTSALRQWPDDSEIAPPRLGDKADADVHVLPSFDDWLTETSGRRPMVLVIDDLQWADQSTLEVIRYVLAGPADRRLAVVATIRPGPATAGESVRGWLADVRRLPRVSELEVSALDRAGTSDLLAVLLGGAVHSSLVDSVHDRAEGNPYFTALLARGLSQDSTALPHGLPTVLRDALATRWDELSPPAQQLTQLVAVAGRPLTARLLSIVTAEIGDTSDLGPPLQESIASRVLVLSEDDTFWFAHPLLAEVLERALLPQQRAAWHAAYARVTAATAGPDDATTTAVELADHLYYAGDLESALPASIGGAAAAEATGGTSEALRLLHRAVRLRDEMQQVEPSHLDLMNRIREVAQRAGDWEAELAAVEDLLTLTDPDEQPLLTAELLVRRLDLWMSTARAFYPVDEAEHAVELCTDHPGSWQRAVALAALSRCQSWTGSADAPATSEQAVKVAAASGSPRAMAHALNARVLALISVAGGVSDSTDSALAQDLAAQAQDYEAYTDSVIWASNSLHGSSRRRATDCLTDGREKLTIMGAPHCFVALLSALEAHQLVDLGDWRQAQERLRVALGSRPGALGDIEARLTAALLASRQGRTQEARANLARAEELSSIGAQGLTQAFDLVRAELSLTAGDSERALEYALAGIGHAVPVDEAEWLLPLAARALADRAQRLRDEGTDPMDALAELDAVRLSHPAVIADTYHGAEYDRMLAALQQVYDAETLRARADPAEPGAWTEAAALCRLVGLPWDEAYAAWRAASALLGHGTDRDGAAVMLRRASQLAHSLQAVPLIDQIEALARTARISLRASTRRPDPAAGPTGLTPREREVLTYIAAGRTYAEIARELVISEKTVSVHVSNLLRKTGTANRVQLAELALRTTTTTGRPTR